MKLCIRHSSLKKRRLTGFLTRKKTRGGRKVITNQRRRRLFGKESTK